MAPIHSKTLSKRLTSRRHFFRARTGLHLGSVQPVPLNRCTEAGGERLICAGRAAMACQFEILFSTADRLRIGAVHHALDEVQRLERQMSVYREDSELSELNRRAQDSPVEVEEKLFGLLRWATRVSGETNGALDVTAGPLTSCWGFQARQGRVPTQQEIDRALNMVGSDLVEFDLRKRSAHFHRKGLELNLGSVGKGYALDRAASFLRRSGLQRALLHAGHSTVLAEGNSPVHPVTRSWPVSIRHPFQKDRDIAMIRLQNRALATSGSSEQFFIHEGKRFGHIVDPRSGYPADQNISVTAVADSATEADALSTAFFVMNLKEIESLCRRRRGLGALVIPKPVNGDRLECFTFGLGSDTVEVYL